MNTGMTMIASVRPSIVRGRKLLIRAPMPSRSGFASEVRSAVSIGAEDIARSAHGLKVSWEFRVLLDLAAKPIDLHIDAARRDLDSAPVGEFVATDDDSWRLRQHAEQPGFDIGQPHDLLARNQFRPLGIESPPSELDRLRTFRRLHRSAQDGRDPQQQLAGLEGLGKIIVGAGLEPS